MTQADPAAGDQQPLPDPVTGDPLTVLGRIPRDAQLLLRDYIAGLEAQAGSARSAADRLERKFKADTDRLLLQLAGARSELDAAIAERDAALRAVTALAGRRVAKHGLRRSSR
jgi:hypothetical protein